MNKKKKGFIIAISIICMAILATIVSISLFMKRPDLDDIVEPNEVTESPVKKEFTFSSAEEVENISDEDLIVIVSNGYTREDFFGEGSFATIDLFDVPMMIPTEEELENSYEYIMMQILYSDDVAEAIDLNSPISSDIINAYAQKDVVEFMDMQNTRGPGEDTGVLVKDEEIIFCGETDSYVEYSARYTDSRSLYENDVLVTHNIPRAYRRVYMKALIRYADMENRPLVMLGTLNKEYVREQLDYFNNKADMIMYREVTEDENSYIYTYYYAYTVYGDFGLNNEANLVKSSFIVDKETHVVSYGNEERVKAVEILGTAQDWPEEW